MTADDMELIHGSGNVFRDLGLPNPEVEQLKAILAAEILGALDREGLTVRRAQELTGFAADAVNSIIAEGVEKSMTKFNRRAPGLTNEEE